MERTDKDEGAETREEQAQMEESPAGKVEAEQLQETDIQKWAGKIGDYNQQEKYVQEGFWGKVKRYAAKVPFAREVVTLYYCAADPATPMKAKATAIGALAYWILPIDLIPDFVPVIGFADDATAVLLAYKALSSQISDEHREKAEQFFAINRDFKVITRP
ncbi:YkvA family protein [Paenibacillus paeoniae]|nr:YkvA family protein [Paenibacillus paeoniae]